MQPYHLLKVHLPRIIAQQNESGKNIDSFGEGLERRDLGVFNLSLRGTNLKNLKSIRAYILTCGLGASHKQEA